MESLIKNSSSVGVKFEAKFLMSISCQLKNLAEGQFREIKVEK